MWILCAEPSGSCTNTPAGPELQAGIWMSLTGRHVLPPPVLVSFLNFAFHDLRTPYINPCINQGRIKLFGAPRQWKHFRPLFQAVFLSGGVVLPTQTVKHQASQSQDRNNKYFILYIEFWINNKI